MMVLIEKQRVHIFGFQNKHFYEKYVFSFKPLKLEYWFSEAEIK